MPHVSVIIPTYNLAEYVKEAIDSVLAQTYRDYEIIVIDDGSTDNTRDIVAPYIRKNLIRYYYQNNKGIAEARNAGIRLSKGRLIAFLDADDIWFPDRLYLQVPAFGLRPNIGLVHADVCKLVNNERISPPCRTNLKGRHIRSHSGNIFIPFLLRKIYISCLTVIVKRECFDKVGHFDKAQPLQGFEDFNMWLRILRYYEAQYIHKPLGCWRERKNNFSKNVQKMMKAHEYCITKVSNQFNLPDTLRQKAINIMLKEWGLKQYAFFKYAEHLGQTVKSKLRYHCFNQRYGI